MRSYTADAIVLRRTNYGEADRILNVLTDEGKVSIIAKGVRKERSKLAGGIELFAVCKLTIREGKSDIVLLTSARLETFFSHIMSDYDRLQFGYFVLKDINKAAEVLPEPEFFYLAKRAFESLDDLSIPLAITELWYRLQMAILLGVGLNVSTDINGMKLVEDARYEFDAAAMSFAFVESGRYTSNHIKVLRLASNRPPSVINHVKGVKDVLQDCVRLAQIAHE